MDAQNAIDLGRDAILTAMLISAPLMAAGAVVGLVIGLVQALTQVQDQTVSFVPKMIAMVAVLGLTLPWLIQKMMDYSHELFTDIPRVVMGG